MITSNSMQRSKLFCMCRATNKPHELQWCGYGVDGIGFFTMDLPEGAADKVSSNSAVVLMDDSRVSVAVIEEGLKILVD